jgi:hypothetical protein
MSVITQHKYQGQNQIPKQQKTTIKPATLQLTPIPTPNLGPQLAMPRIGN